MVGNGDQHSMIIPYLQNNPLQKIEADNIRFLFCNNTNFDPKPSQNQ